MCERFDDAVFRVRRHEVRRIDLDIHRVEFLSEADQINPITLPMPASADVGTQRLECQSHPASGSQNIFFVTPGHRGPPLGGHAPAVRLNYQIWTLRPKPLDDPIHQRTRDFDLPS